MTFKRAFLVVVHLGIKSLAILSDNCIKQQCQCFAVNRFYRYMSLKHGEILKIYILFYLESRMLLKYLDALD